MNLKKETRHIRFRCPSCQYCGTGWEYVGEQNWDIPELGKYREKRVDILANCPKCHSTRVIRTIRERR